MNVRLPNALRYNRKRGCEECTLLNRLNGPTKAWSCWTSAGSPAEEIIYTYTDYREVAKAIREMVIRGAPAIGVAAAMGVALGVHHSSRHFD